MSDPMIDVFNSGVDVTIEFVELSGGAAHGVSDGTIGFVEAPEVGAPRSAADAGLDGESDGAGTRNPAPKGSGDVPSVRP